MIRSLTLDSYASTILPAGSGESQGVNTFNVEDGYLFADEGDFVRISHERSREWYRIHWSRVRFSVCREAEAKPAKVKR